MCARIRPGLQSPAKTDGVGASDAPMGRTDQHRGVSGPLEVLTSAIGLMVGTAAAAAFRHCRLVFIIRRYCDVCI